MTVTRPDRDPLTTTPQPISGGSVGEAQLRSVDDVAWPEARASHPETPLAEAVRRLRKSTTALVGVAIVALLTAVAFVVINLLVDLTYTFLDPRIRYA